MSKLFKVGTLLIRNPISSISFNEKPICQLLFVCTESFESNEYDYETEKTFPIYHTTARDIIDGSIINRWGTHMYIRVKDFMITYTGRKTLLDIMKEEFLNSGFRERDQFNTVVETINNIIKVAKLFMTNRDIFENIIYDSFKLIESNNLVPEKTANEVIEDIEKISKLELLVLPIPEESKEDYLSEYGIVLDHDMDNDILANHPLADV